MHSTPISSRSTLVNERILCRGRVLKEFLFGLAALCLFLGTVGQAQSQFIYWGNFGDGTIERANIDGTGQQNLISGLNGPPGSLIGPAGIALDLANGLMYWTEFSGGGDIRRANLDGSGQTILVSELVKPLGLALDLGGDLMYWCLEPGEIWRAKLDGSDPTPLVKGLSSPRGLALDLAGGKMYWTENGTGTISRANLDGTRLERLVDRQRGPRFLALDLSSRKMYWTNLLSGEIRRASLDGSGQEILISGLPALGIYKGPASIALDLANGKMYWSQFDLGNPVSDIRRANLDGSGQEILITGLPSPFGIALDLGVPGTAVFFAVAAPASVPSGNSFDLTVTALDPYGNRDVNYQGTVTFSTTDPDSGVVLPADYTFTTGVGGDNGVHTFPGGVMLVTVGDQTITVNDTVSGITGSVTITVGPGP